MSVCLSVPNFEATVRLHGGGPDSNFGNYINSEISSRVNVFLWPNFPFNAPKTLKNAQMMGFGRFGPFGLKFSQNVRNQKVNWPCNNFGPKKCQPHPKTPK